MNKGYKRIMKFVVSSTFSVIFIVLGVHWRDLYILLILSVK